MRALETLPGLSVAKESLGSWGQSAGGRFWLLATGYWLLLKDWYESRDSRQKDRDDAGIPGGWAGCSCYCSEGRAVRCGSAEDAGHGRLRCGAARIYGIRQEKGRDETGGGAFEEVGGGGREVPAGISTRFLERRYEDGRPRAGRRIQADSKGRCDWHQQGSRVCGRGEASSFPRRRCHARFDVPSCAGIDWCFELSFARISWDSHGRPHGDGSGDGAESGDRRGRYRGQCDPGEGRGAWTEWRLRHAAEIQAKMRLEQ